MEGSALTRRRRTMLLRLALLAALLLLLYWAGGWLATQVQPRIEPWYETYGQGALVLSIAVYVVFMTLPFVPAIEISLALLMILGVQAVAVVYFSTLGALCLSFVIGRSVPAPWILRLLGWLHLERSRELVEHLLALEPAERLDLLVERAPTRAIPFLLRHRYLAIAVAFNIPGNALIGGGGGIGLLAGMCRLFDFPRYALMVALAISPIPLLMLFHDWWT